MMFAVSLLLSVAVHSPTLLSPALQGGNDPNQFNGFMVLGYIVMWLVVMVYLFTLANRQRNVKEEVELLEQLLREDEEAPE
jgi:CcmD family protein